MKTYKFRLKDNQTQHLVKMAGSVNYVWNFCNETALKYVTHKSKPVWLSGYDLEKQTSGCTKELGLLNETIACVCGEYALRRKQFKKLKLFWRSRKRSLSWIPFKARGIKVISDTVKFNKITLRFWKSKEIEGEIKCGSFTQDSQGRWYISLVCERAIQPKFKSGGEIGIDLGLKTIATLSNGDSLNRENITGRFSEKLAMAQRAKKKKQVSKVQAKIKNIRKDWNHKTTTKLINQFDRIIIGDVSASKLKKTKMAKSVSDAGWSSFKTMLAYKAIALGVEYKEVKENGSTITCSGCFVKSGPSGLSGLGVREWICSSCGSVHDRDVNAAKNILRFGHESPIKGNLKTVRGNPLALA